MTSDAIQKLPSVKLGEKPIYAACCWLKEIAWQLARANEGNMIALETKLATYQEEES